MSVLSESCGLRPMYPIGGGAGWKTRNCGWQGIINWCQLYLGEWFAALTIPACGPVARILSASRSRSVDLKVYQRFELKENNLLTHPGRSQD